MLDGDGADAVGQAGELLQAVGLEPPVAGLPHHRLAVDQGSAQAQAVLATLAELEHTKPAINCDQMKSDLRYTILQQALFF